MLSSAARSTTTASRGATRTRRSPSLRGDKKKEKSQRDNTLLVWQDVGAATAARRRVRSVEGRDLPERLRAERDSRRRAGRATASRMYRRPQGAGGRSSTPSPTEPKANVDVWHWKDAEVQSVQIVRLAQERRATLAGGRSTSPAKKLVRVCRRRDAQRDADVRDPKWAIGRDRHDVSHEVQWGEPQGRLLSREHRRPASARSIDKRLSRTMGSSPDSKWFLYLKDKKVFAYNLETGKRRDLGGGGQDQLRRRRGRSSVREADVRRRRLVEGRQVGDRSITSYDLWSRAARRRQGDESHRRRRRRAADPVPPRASRSRGRRRTRRSRRWRDSAAAADEDEGVDLSKPLTALGVRRVDEEVGLLHARAGRRQADAAHLRRQEHRRRR